MDPYKKKYLKYKAKYLSSKDLLEQEGGAFSFIETEDIYDNLEELKEKASIEGKQLLDTWLGNRESNGIDEILKYYFNVKGKPVVIKATAYSDYYKWTMMPVIWNLHDFFKKKNNGKNTLKVTFGIDIRDKDMRDAINIDPELRTEILKSLNKLANRVFDKSIFEEMNADKTLLNSTLSKECIEYICSSRSLAKSVTMGNEGRPLIKEDEEVHISFFRDHTAKYNPSDVEAGLWFIEARGPWPRVTWLETSLMQAVYEAYLRYNLKKLATQKKIAEDKAYERWLYGALLRCARSVAFTRLVQQRGNMTPALFTGRRTGGYLFLLLQNLFFAHHFNQFTKDGPNVDASGKTRCLGTSSVDCYYELTRLKDVTKNELIKCLRPVGTHAHELSMVISVLFPYFDKNKYDLPLTQIIGHELYRVLSAETRPFPAGVMFPMLPDTLGTAAFMKAANWVKMDDGASFVSKITGARQDSGKLENFKKLMENWNYKDDKGSLKPMMASEIDNTETLLKATRGDYTTSGAGGFYGDSVKVWNTFVSSPSMAVKAVNVEFCVPEGEKQFYQGLEFPHITITDKEDNSGHVKGYPIKIGDPEDMNKPALAEGKLSLDKTLPADLIEVIKTWVSKRRIRAFSNMDNDDQKIKTDSLNINSFTGDKLTPTQEFLASIRG
jgi:nicotinic acid phosphoribosyltransferase